MAHIRILLCLCLLRPVFGIVQEMSWRMDPEAMSWPPGDLSYSYEMLQFGPNPNIGVDL